MKDAVVIPVCPNGCEGELYKTDMVVVEGALRECRSCGQLISSCTSVRYELSSKVWDHEDGTWPSDKDIKRLIRRKSRDLDVISHLMPGGTNHRLLDVGCSNGAFIWHANNLGWNAEGVDPSPKAVENGVHRGLNIHLGYLHEIGFEDNTFNAITLYEVIEHVDKPKDLFEECNRILKPGGVLLVGTGNVDSWTRWIRKERWDFFDMNAHGGHISFFSPKSLRVLASRTGFSMKQVRTSSVKVYEKGEVPYILFRAIKILTEVLNIPAKLLGRGHQMEVYFVAVKETAR